MERPLGGRRHHRGRGWWGRPSACPPPRGSTPVTMGLLWVYACQWSGVVVYHIVFDRVTPQLTGSVVAGVGDAVGAVVLPSALVDGAGVGLEGAAAPCSGALGPGEGLLVPPPPPPPPPLWSTAVGAAVDTSVPSSGTVVVGGAEPVEGEGVGLLLSGLPPPPPGVLLPAAVGAAVGLSLLLPLPPLLPPSPPAPGAGAAAEAEGAAVGTRVTSPGCAVGKPEPGAPVVGEGEGVGLLPAPPPPPPPLCSPLPTVGAAVEPWL